MLLLRVAALFEEEKIPYALIGGYALALHGAVRGTIDVDVVLELQEACFVRAEAALNRLGLVSRLPVNAQQIFQFREEYIRERNLFAWSFYNPQSPIDVLDILITEDLRQMKTVPMRYLQQVIRVASIADLIAMKKKAGRPQDLQDIAALRALQKRSKK